MPSVEDGTGISMTQTSQNVSSQNMHFVSADTPWKWELAATPDETAALHGFDDAELGEFVERPIEIQNYEWTPGTKLSKTFNPWSDFFSNPDVLQKINRFRNLRCELCLNVVVNGNGFYHGRSLLSYNPYLKGDQVTVNRGFFEQDLIAASNKPCLLIDPTTSEGGQLCLPFIWDENYVDITVPNWHSEIGECDIHDFDILQHANGATDPISVIIYAWAKNVSLSIPTTVEAQSNSPSHVEVDKFGYPKPYAQRAQRHTLGPGSQGDYCAIERQAQTSVAKKTPKKSSNTGNYDEFTHDGLISKPASAVAEAANILSMVPYVAPYAKATKMVASKLGDMARILGYSRPAVLTDEQPYVPRICGNLANTDAPESLYKLALDSKNEVTIDSRSMGLSGADELMINGIARRLTYWRQFDWEKTHEAGSLLASMSVQPFCVNTIFAPPVKEIHSTALAFASCPFEAWQGSIKFHFKVICSEYHRGRLRLVYNPKTNNSGPVASNQTYSTIIDIHKDREFDYTCKWTDVRAWNSCMGIQGASSATLFSDSAAIFGGTPFDNGTLSVYTTTRLATPSPVTSGIKIQVWVSAGDDFALSIPSDGISNLSYFRQQAEMKTPDSQPALAQASDNTNNPMGGNPLPTFGTIEAPLLKENKQYLRYQGERVLNFRDPLRRYQYSNSYWPYEIGSGFRHYTLNTPGMPLFRGWDPNGISQGKNSTEGNSPYNYCSMTLLNYLAPAFVCQRGSIRHKFIVSGGRSLANKGSLSVTRHPVTSPVPLSETARPLDSYVVGDRRRELQKLVRSTMCGTAITPLHLNNTLTIEVPFYSIGKNFRPGRFLDVSGTGDHQGIEVACEVSDMNGDNNLRVDQFTSIGEDFTLAMFVGAPVLYTYMDPTATQ